MRIILHKDRNVLGTKDEENETNYKMLEEIFYLLRKVIVRIPFNVSAFIFIHIQSEPPSTIAAQYLTEWNIFPYISKKNDSDKLNTQSKFIEL